MDMTMNSEFIKGKLVRDKIPAIIMQDGRKPVYHQASEEEYRTKLLDKLVEEATEFIYAPSEEELADIVEVLDAIIDLFGFDIEEIENMKMAKLKNRGGFREKLILCSVMDD